MQQQLRQAHSPVEDGHKALTAVWHAPLSLFGACDATAAAARGVPFWAVASVLKAQRLVDGAAELGDLTDVYEAQFLVAMKEEKGLLRAPVQLLIEKLGDLGLQLSAHVAVLAIAREAFDAVAEGRGCAVAADFAPLSGEGDSAGASLMDPQTGASSEEQREQLPIAILRYRGRLGKIWGQSFSATQQYGEAFLGSVNSTGQHSADALRRTLKRREPLVKDRPSRTWARMDMSSYL